MCLLQTAHLVNALLQNRFCIHNAFEITSYSDIGSPIFSFESRASQEPLDTSPRNRRGTDVPHLNVIIPAYNEESRIIETLHSYTNYLESHWPTYSIIVVDDGSTDDSADVVKRFSEYFPTVRCVSLTRNFGKGIALSRGIAELSSTIAFPQLVLTADADGSADLASVSDLFLELQCLVQSNWDLPVLICGYRTYDETAMGRQIFRWGFRTLVRIVCGTTGSRDTQCGFKLMTVSAAVPLYSSLYLGRWSHDVEVLLRARMMGVQVAEAPVRWVDKQGSKLKIEGIFKVAVQMFADVVICRVAYLLGIWTIEQQPERNATTQTE